MELLEEAKELKLNNDINNLYFNIIFFIHYKLQNNIKFLKNIINFK